MRVISTREAIDAIERELILCERLATYCHRELAEPMGPMPRRMLTLLFHAFEDDCDRLMQELKGDQPLRRVVS